MTEIIGQPEWSPVRLLGKDEFATGGEDGNMNEQAKSLANRTELLMLEKAGKDEIIQGQYRFETLAKFDAKKSALPVDCTVVIDEAGPNQGANTWDGITLKKSPYDPLQLSKNYADANGLFKPYIVLNTSTTLAEDFKQKGWYIFVSATPAIAAGLPEPNAGILFVVNEGNMVRQKWTPYNSNSEYTRVSNVSAVFPPFQKLITQAALDVRLATELSSYFKTENIDQYVNKPYEIISLSKNLYDKTKKQLGIIVGNNGALQSAAGWSCSDFIPVTEGQNITISGIRRQNAAFYDKKGGVGLIALSFSTSASNPLTLQAPAGAKYLVVNIDSNTITGTNVQVEMGQNATPYEPYGKNYVIDASYLSTNTAEKRCLKINSNNATLTGVIDGLPISLEMWLTKVGLTGEQTVFNFAADYVNNILQRSPGDDVAPMRMDGATIGANHGYRKTNLIVTGHGKTNADIGSVWTANSKEYVIISIVDVNTISVTSRNDNTDAIATTFTHVSGAENITSFTATSASTLQQWYPSIRDRRLNCFIDNVKIDLTKDAIHSFKNTVKFLESYSIMKKADMVEWLITNKGSNHINYDAVPSYTVNFGYTFDHELGCTIYFGGVGRKTVPLVDQMITQSIQLAQGNGTVYNYIPKAISFTAGGFSYNFSQLENLYSKNPSVALYLTSALQETETNPIDRIIMLNDQIGYATGYLPVLDAAPNVRANNASNKYLEIRNSSLKIYPRLIDSASISQINEGDAFAAIAYRKYFKRSAARTCNYVIRSEFGDYLYLDWHTHKVDEIELPADLIGREFEIHEKSSNVTLLSKFSSNSILVNIDETKAYGYLVLKFK